MIELSPRAVAKHTGIREKELNTMRNDYPLAFDSLILGSTQLQQGYSVGEVMFKLRQSFKPDIRAYEAEIRMLNERIIELENVI